MYKICHFAQHYITLYCVVNIRYTVEHWRKECDNYSEVKIMPFASCPKAQTQSRWKLNVLESYLVTEFISVTTPAWSKGTAMISDIDILSLRVRESYIVLNVLQQSGV